MTVQFFNVLGTMSGTSLDGIDISLLRTDGLSYLDLKKNYYFKYSGFLKKELDKALNMSKNIHQNKSFLKRLNKRITFEYVKNLRNIINSETVDLIGFHGQTIYHSPIDGFSLQLGDPQILANLLNTNVIFDFRSNDLKHGGEGAPISPIFHKILLKKINVDLPSCIINIGGIANLTYCDKSNLIGFDTGPGNCLIDTLVKKFYNIDYDDMGKISSTGTINKKIIDLFLRDSFFKKKPPKSLDRLYFNSILNEVCNFGLKPEDLLASISEVTSYSIINSFKYLPNKPKNLIFSGGGVHNKYLMSSFLKYKDFEILYLKNYELDEDFIESQLIGYLAVRSIKQLPITFPKTTGVFKPLSGGYLYKPRENH